MKTAKLRYKPSQRQLQTFEESWKEDHDAIMDGLDKMEEFFRLFTGLFEAIDGLIQSRRGHVFRGDCLPDSELDELEKKLYVRWLDLADDMQRDMKELGQAFKLDGSKKFEECQGVARSRLEKWIPVLPSSAVGLRTHVLDAEDAAELQGIIEENTRIGRPTQTSLAIPNADESLRNLVRSKFGH